MFVYVTTSHMQSWQPHFQCLYSHCKSQKQQQKFFENKRTNQKKSKTRCSSQRMTFKDHNSKRVEGEGHSEPDSANSLPMSFQYRSCTWQRFYFLFFIFFIYLLFFFNIIISQGTPQTIRVWPQMQLTLNNCTMSSPSHGSKYRSRRHVPVPFRFLFGLARLRNLT